jgi:hypothetical protein
MRNLRATTHADATRAAVAALWQTDLFREAHATPGSYVFRVVEALTQLPKLWCELDDVPVERSHFLAWMGILPLRHGYTNPAISDLYYFHEYVHLITMTHSADPEVERWQQKIWNNERDASLASEVYVYFEMPTLRAMTFEFEIWADRFLARPDVVALHRDDRPAFEAMMESERERAMSHPIEGDVNEALIASYHELNVRWIDIWRERYLEVERAMQRFTHTCADDPAGAIETLHRWALDEQGGGLCPFEAEARAFAGVIASQRVN